MTKKEANDVNMSAVGEDGVKSVPLCTSKVFMSINKGQHSIISQGSLENEDNLLMLLKKAPGESEEKYMGLLVEYLQDDVNSIIRLIAPIAVESDVFRNHSIEFDVKYELDDENHVFAYADIFGALNELGCADELTDKATHCLEFAETYIKTALLADTCDLLEAIAKACISGIDGLDFMQKMMLGYFEEN